MDSCLSKREMQSAFEVSHGGKEKKYEFLNYI